MTFLDRIKETSTSTGTGTFTLGGAVLGYKVFTNGTYKYCIVNETESEWEVGEGTVASGVLTRTTIEASSNGGAAVVFSAGTKYVFNTVSAAYVNSLVPYTGATAAVNLGAYGITSDYLQLSTSPTASGAVGRMLWNDQIGSTETTLKGGSVVLKNGVDLVARVVNKVTPAATLTKATYKAVRVSGAQGQRLAIAYAQANTDNNSADTIGLVCETIAANQEGFIITVGQLTGINTTGSLQGETWADGDVLYLSPTTAGNLTNIKPTGATGHIVVIGYVEYAHANNGSIYVKIMNGWELDELHNVYINAVANNDVLVYESSSSLWKNKSIATILGYTPADDSLVVHLAGAENITGVKTFQNAIKTTTGNNLLNTGGGNTVIGYTADPASSATYKLDVNGSQKIAGGLFVFGGTYTSNVGMIWKDSAYGLAITGSGTNYSTSLFSSGGLYVFRVPQGGQVIEFVGSQRNLGAIQQNSGHNFLNYSDSSTYIGYTSVQPTVYKLDVNGTVRIVSNLNLAAYTTSSSVPGTVAGLLGFDSSGNVITTSAGGGGGITGSGTAGQVTYWSGTSAVTGSSNLVWDATNNTLGIGNTASVTHRLSITGSFAIASGFIQITRNLLPHIALNTTGANYGLIQNQSSTSWSLAYGSGTNALGTAALTWFGSTGNVAINTTTDGGQRLQVIGSMRVGTTAASAMYWDDTNARLIIGNTSGTARLDVGASTTSAASLRIRSGTAPTTPNEGDIWQDGTNIKIYIGGSTKTFTII